MIFKKSSDDKLIDTELLLYPQYISLKNQKNINNQKINNISQNIEVYTEILNDPENTISNNTKVGEKYFDIIKSNFNEDSNLDDITKYCAATILVILHYVVVVKINIIIYFQKHIMMLLTYFLFTL